MKVAVLGCGPAGLLCAEAVLKKGGSPVIFSKKQKSHIPGSLHLREAIPGVTSVYPDNAVTIVRMGTAKGYAQKVYRDPDRYTGWENYQSVYKSWSAVTAYEFLWAKWGALVVDTDIDKQVMLDLENEYDLVISTLPAEPLCYNKRAHTFDGEPYWIQTLPTPEEDAHRELIVYNGMPGDHWYRYSILGGICAIETTVAPAAFYGSKGITANGEWTRGIKPTGNTCTCYPGILRAGRWAEWRHGVLLHDAYHKAAQAVKGARLHV